MEERAQEQDEFKALKASPQGWSERSAVTCYVISYCFFSCLGSDKPKCRSFQNVSFQAHSQLCSWRLSPDSTRSFPPKPPIPAANRLSVGGIIARRSEKPGAALPCNLSSDKIKKPAQSVWQFKTTSSTVLKHQIYKNKVGWGWMALLVNTCVIGRQLKIYPSLDVICCI